MHINKPKLQHHLQTTNMQLHILLIFSSAWALVLGKERIIEGSDAKRHQFPYIVSFDDGSHFCGGSIVSQTWVISAGHCFVHRQNQLNSIFAIAGLLLLNEVHPEKQKIPVSKAIVHPNFIHDYNLLKLDNDIALVKLARPLQFTQAVKPVGLPQPNQEFSGAVWVSGWGSSTMNTSKPVATVHLQCLQMNIITNKECQDVRTKFDVDPAFKIWDSMICSTPLPTQHNSSACHGDSGGPLVQNGMLIGIVSFSQVECRMDADIGTNVFTRVSSYIDFIDKYIKDM